MRSLGYLFLVEMFATRIDSYTHNKRKYRRPILPMAASKAKRQLFKSIQESFAVHEKNGQNTQRIYLPRQPDKQVEIKSEMKEKKRYHHTAHVRGETEDALGEVSVMDVNTGWDHIPAQQMHLKQQEIYQNILSVISEIDESMTRMTINTPINNT